MDANKNSLRRLPSIGSIMDRTYALAQVNFKKELYQYLYENKYFNQLYMNWLNKLLSNIAMTRHELWVCVLIPLSASKLFFLAYMRVLDSMFTLKK